MIWSDMQTEAMRSVMSDSHHGTFFIVIGKGFSPLSS